MEKISAFMEFRNLSSSFCDKIIYAFKRWLDFFKNKLSFSNGSWKFVSNKLCLLAGKKSALLNGVYIYLPK